MYVKIGTEFKVVTNNRYSTTILAGIICIIDKPKILTVNEVLVLL